ncbi:hypothetical protein NM688_g9075 [Phlebia brevispora]|uniref:Uncharacterized protein n=1 Tax=Phlebia brevispora TaxID=194682 RepID=A0ACC1RN82_9APHY|nr:hypothetical protein NM688_g9075 [Phlebia brevispora]
MKFATSISLLLSLFAAVPMLVAAADDYNVVAYAGPGCDGEIVAAVEGNIPDAGCVPSAGGDSLQVYTLVDSCVLTLYSNEECYAVGTTQIWTGPLSDTCIEGTGGFNSFSIDC